MSAEGATEYPKQDAPGDSPSAAPASQTGMRLVKAYVAIYAFLLVAYIAHAFLSSETVDPATRFISRRFPGLAARVESGDFAIDPQAVDAAYDPGARPIRLAEEIAFEGAAGQRFQIQPGSRLTRDEAVALAITILGDAQLLAAGVQEIEAAGLGSEERETRSAELERQMSVPHLAVYKPGWYLPWEWIMTIYNLGGLFLLLVVFVRRPVAEYLARSARETREALERARAAQAEAEELKIRYEQALAEVAAERKRMEETAAIELAEERDRIVQAARHEAAGMLESLQSSLEAEVASAAGRLRSAVAGEAVRQAREMLASETDDQDHQAAVDSFIREVRKARLP